MPNTSRLSQAIESRITGIGSDLARTLGDVLDAIPGAPHRPQWLAKSLGVNTILTSRLLKAARQEDPLAVAHMMPGPEPLRRLLRAAEKKKINPALIRHARDAVDRFEQLIAVEAGDRSALDAIISGWLPDAREKVELLAKQSVFRGVSQLLGTTSDVHHTTVMLYPSGSDPHRADQVWILGTRGLRRVRPGMAIMYDTVHSAEPLLTVTGEPIEALHDLLLEEFCSTPLPTLEVTRTDDVAQYTLSGDEIGVQSAVNLAHATFLPGKKEVFRTADSQPQPSQVAVGVGGPAKLLIFDILMHETLFPGQEPSLALYRTAGVFNRKSAGREMDRLDVIESVQSMGRGIARFRVSEIPGYRDMLRYVCEKRGWEGSSLRGYRCRIEYPMYSSEVVMGFELPARM